MAPYYLRVWHGSLLVSTPTNIAAYSVEAIADALQP